MSPNLGPQKEKIPITDYLRATDTVSRPLAIFLVLVILAVFTSILFGLFVGGRWLYDELKGNNKPANSSLTDTIDKDNSGESSSGANQNNNVGQLPSVTPTPTPTSVPASSSPAATPASTMQNTGNSIPNTGPEPE